MRDATALRIVEVVPASSATPWVLRTGWYGCNMDAQHFAYRGHSLYSKGAGSYVNMRELQHLRAHGDTRPWAPLLRETRQTRVQIDEAPASDPITFERRLLGLLATLDRG